MRGIGGQGSGAARPSLVNQTWLILITTIAVRYSIHQLEWRIIMKKLKVRCFGVQIEATDIDPRLIMICLLALAAWAAKTWFF